jgi:uncharacterized repeat protein (TIGR03943 family)
VSTVDRSRAVVAVGALVLWMASTDAMLKYLKASMRPWLLLCGLVLVVFGVYSLARSRNEHAHEHVHRSRSGWLLIVPIVVVLAFGAQSLGAFAASRSGTQLPEYSFDIAAYASSTGQSRPALKLSDIEEGVRAKANREFLATHDVVLIGFVTRPVAFGPGTFVLTRFLLSCCAADAIAINLAIVGARAVPGPNQWVKVTAHLEPRPQVVGLDGGMPVLRADAIRRVHAPSGPYESLR